MGSESTDRGHGSPKIGLGRLVAYGMGDIYGGGAFLVIGMLLLFYLTEVVGLPPWSGALIFGIGKVWDAVSDPLMGRISDRTRSAFGRRRLWILIGILPVFGSFALLWTALPEASPGIQILYSALAYILFSTVFTMVMVPYSALNADITPDFRDRSRLSGVRMGFSMVSALLAGTIPKIIIDGRDGGFEGYRTMGLVFGAFYALILIPVVFGTREIRGEDSAAPSGGLMDLLRSFAALGRNRSFRLHMGMYICAYSAMDVLMILFAYYLTYVLKRPGLYSAAMGTLMGCEIAALALWVTLANRRGKGVAFAWGLGFWSLGLVLTAFLGSGTAVAAVLAVCGLLGFGLSAGVFVPWAALPSVTDVGELIDGENRAGLYAGAMTLARKLAQGAVAVPLVGLSLGFLGFGNGAAAAGANITGLRVLLVAGTVPLLILGIVFARRFPLTPATHAVLRDEIERRRRSDSPPDPQVRDVCARLAGRSWSESA